jgi:hypothetical protein
MKLLFCYGTNSEFIKIKNFFKVEKNFVLKVLYGKQPEDMEKLNLIEVSKKIKEEYIKIIN